MSHAAKMIMLDEHPPHAHATADVRTHVRKLILDLVRQGASGTGCGKP